LTNPHLCHPSEKHAEVNGDHWIIISLVGWKIKHMKNIEKCSKDCCGPSNKNFGASQPKWWPCDHNQKSNPCYVDSKEMRTEATQLTTYKI
jgi:hypothetical protein